MNATSIEPQDTGDTTSLTQQQLLELARHLDRFGRHAEQFLYQQLDELGQAVDEFEREKAAWRRQLRRESSHLARQREEIEQLSGGNSSAATAAAFNPVAAGVQRKRQTADAAARKSGVDPVTLFLQLRAASSTQVGLLLFEISKLNRDMGGRGLTFEVAAVRTPRRSLLSRDVGAGSSEEILELTGFSTLPLAARGRHVSLDVDVTDRIEDWIAFKSRLIQSTLGQGDMAATYRKSRAIKYDGQFRCLISKATRRVDDVVYQEREKSSAALFTNVRIDSVGHQVLRLESCYERLVDDSGLCAHAVLNVSP